MGRAPCCDKNGLKKGPWTPEEDHDLIAYVQLHGPGNWRNLPKNAGLQRCGKSCRLRWTNYLRPDIKRGRFSFDEEETIIQLHSILGNKWSAIAGRLPGRTDNEIKNYWNTHIRKRLLRNGIDPVTHAPRIDLQDLSTILRTIASSPSSLLNMTSNLLAGAAHQAAFLNPELLRIASTLLSLKQENPESLLQYLQQNQYHLGSHNSPIMQHQIPHHIQHPVSDQTQSCTPPSDFAAPAKFNSVLDQTQLTQVDLDRFLSNLTESRGQNLSHENFIPASLNESFDSKQPDHRDHHHHHHVYNNNGNRNLGLDSLVSSTPLTSSPTPLNSSSTFVNSSSTEDERESYCSSLLKFEIPGSSDFNYFM